MTTTNSVKRHRMRKLVAYLSEKEGREMEFISFYIPREKSIDETIQILRDESDPSEIKSGSARYRVQDSLNKVVQRLKLQKEIPENGLAIFAGTFPIKDREGEVLNIEEIIPPEPITAYLYAIDDHFQLEPLRECCWRRGLWGLSPWIQRRPALGYSMARDST